MTVLRCTAQRLAIPMFAYYSPVPVRSSHHRSSLFSFLLRIKFATPITTVMQLVVMCGQVWHGLVVHFFALELKRETPSTGIEKDDK